MIKWYDILKYRPDLISVAFLFPWKDNTTIPYVKYEWITGKHWKEERSPRLVINIKWNMVLDWIFKKV